MLTVKDIAAPFRAVGRGLDKGLTGVENFFHGIQKYFLEYNINSEFKDLMESVDDGTAEPWTTPRREQFWRMVSYRDTGRW